MRGRLYNEDRKTMRKYVVQNCFLQKLRRQFRFSFKIPRTGNFMYSKQKGTPFIIITTFSYEFYIVQQYTPLHLLPSVIFLS